jgi:hypothetical protein
MQNCKFINIIPCFNVGRDSSVGIATRYGLDGRGIESRLGGGIFQNHPDRPCSTPNLPYNGYRVISGGTAAGAWCWPLTPSSAEVKESVYLYSPSGPSWRVLGWILQCFNIIKKIMQDTYLPDYNNFANIFRHKHFSGVRPCLTLILHFQTEKRSTVSVWPLKTTELLLLIISIGEFWTCVGYVLALSGCALYYVGRQADWPWECAHIHVLKLKSSPWYKYHGCSCTPQR